MTFIAVTLVVAIMYYSIMPKSDYMIRHLKNEEQVNAWMDVYLNMKHRHLAGLVIGALSSLPVAFALC